MIHIQIIWVGKTSNGSINNLIKEYLDRLKPFAKIDVYEVKDPKLKSIQESQLKEKNDILKLIKDSSYLICLDETGEQFNSINFSNKICQLKNKAINNISFIIGGSFGIDAELLEKADLILSLSKMTFTHEMIRPFLIEQIYRAFMIESGSKYHH